MVIISKEIEEALQYRIQQEEQSVWMYRAMSHWLNLNGFPGAAKLWMKYSKEERQHSKWAYERLLSLNILPITPALEKPKMVFKSLQNVVAISLEHEMEVTKQCEEFAKKCQELSDYKNFELALQYCKEQTEEIAKLQDIVDQINSFGESKEALRLLDNWLDRQV